MYIYRYIRTLLLIHFPIYSNGSPIRPPLATGSRKLGGSGNVLETTQNGSLAHGETMGKM